VGLFVPQRVSTQIKHKPLKVASIGRSLKRPGQDEASLEAISNGQWGNKQIIRQFEIQDNLPIAYCPLPIDSYNSSFQTGSQVLHEFATVEDYCHKFQQPDARG